MLSFQLLPLKIGEFYFDYLSIFGLLIFSKYSNSGWGEPTEKVSENIKKFRENDNVQHFVLKQTFRKEKEKFKNEFQDLWIRKTILTTSGLSLLSFCLSDALLLPE